jgi:hypothetical protein
VLSRCCQGVVEFFVKVVEAGAQLARRMGQCGLMIVAIGSSMARGLALNDDCVSPVGR